jgi:hypothetical protein
MTANARRVRVPVRVWARPRPALAPVLLLAATLAACQHSRLAARAEAERLEHPGDPTTAGRAVVYYDQALLHDVSGEAERRRVSAARHAAIAEYIGGLVASARGQPGWGLTTLAALRDALPAWGAEEQRPQVEEAFLYTAEAEMIRAEAALDQRQFAVAARYASGVQSTLRPEQGARFEERLARIRGLPAFMYRTIAAEPDDDDDSAIALRYLLLRAAAAIDPEAAWKLTDKTAELAGRLSAALRPDWVISGPPACNWAKEALGRRFLRNAESPVQLGIRLSACSRSEDLHRRTEVVSYQDPREVRRSVEEPFYAAGEDGAMELKVRHTTLIDSEPATSTMAITVNDVSRRASIVGLFRFEAHRARRQEFPLRFEEHGEDSFYWSPDAPKPPRPETLSGLAERVVQRLADSVAGYQTWAATVTAADFAGIAEKELAGGREGRAARADALAVAAAPSVVSRSSIRLAARFGLTEADVRALLGSGRVESLFGGASAANAPLALPAVPEVNAILAEEGHLVLDRNTAEGVAVHDRPAIEIAAVANQAALSGAPAAIGAGVTFNVGPDATGIISFGAQSDHLGGRAGGAWARLIVRCPEDECWLRMGFGYARQNAGRETYESLGFPIVVARPLMPWIQASLELLPNLLGLMRDANDLHHYSTLSGRLSIDLLPRVVVGLSATHYLGIDAAHPVHFGLELGVRL